MGISNTSYYLRTDNASELQNLVLEMIVCSPEKVRTSFYLQVCTRHLQSHKYIQVQSHCNICMVRDDHIELVGVIYIQKRGKDHGVRQLQFYKGS